MESIATDDGFTITRSGWIASFLLVIVLLVFVGQLDGQGRPVSATDYRSWPQIQNDVNLSGGGKYVQYVIREDTSATLVLQATDNSWKKEIPNASDAVITKDSRWGIFSMPQRRIGVVELGKETLETIPDADSFKVASGNEGVWIAYQQGRSGGDLVLHNLGRAREQTYKNVNDFQFSDNAKVLLLQTETDLNGVKTNSLAFVDLPEGKTETIWSGPSRPAGFTVDDAFQQIAFIAGDSDQAIWYYRRGAGTARMLVNSATTGMPKDSTVGSPDLHFSRTGDKLFFLIQRRPKSKVTPAPEASVFVDVWHYKDKALPPLQQQQLDGSAPNSMAVINLEDKRIVTLQREGESVRARNEKYVLFATNDDNAYEGKWRLVKRPSLFLVATSDGSRTLVKENLLRIKANAVLSPQSKYVVYYDPERKCVFSYETGTGITRNITEQILVPLYDDEDDRGGAPSPFIDFVPAWIANDAAFLLYDRYDIWQIDPKGEKPPINITRGYGRRSKTVLRLVNCSSDKTLPIVVTSGDKLLLTAFNRIDRTNGFYETQIGASVGPRRLTMGPYLYHRPQLVVGMAFLAPWVPVKASKAETYVVRRMSATDAPNLFATNDFVRFTQLTNVHPEARVNWLTAELVRWETSDGRQAEGVLYKPENFDPTKKYPLIVNVYESASDGLNAFIYPTSSDGQLNIPSFVSRGYLVFVPDIRYRLGHPGDSAYRYVVSGVRHLARFPWVDSDKIGLHGYSFGGFEVNYLVTHSKLFAAAVSGAGVVDFISGYNAVGGRGYSLQFLYEAGGQNRLGTNLWERPSLYIENTPILLANRISAPMLILNNKNDESVPWAQGVQLFMALRRLGKKAWMLQYDGEGHGIRKDKNQRDLSIRLAQFFDHYLKGAAPPKWMTEGVPSNLKGVEPGLELDMTGKEP
jgi:dienelactone hydrolase